MGTSQFPTKKTTINLGGLFLHLIIMAMTTPMKTNQAINVPQMIVANTNARKTFFNRSIIM